MATALKAGAQVSTPGNVWLSLKLAGRAEVRLRGPERGTTKVVDASLMSSSLSNQFALIAVEVGFTQSKISLIVLRDSFADLTEKYRNEFSWGYGQMTFIHFARWTSRRPSSNNRVMVSR
ncbi:hypothetical protein V8E54_011229 [Elaphomyces granulatus]